MALTVTYTTDSPTGSSDIRINSYTTGNQSFPDILGLQNGGAVVAYNSDTNQVFVDFLNSFGDIIGTYRTPFGVTSSASGQPSLTRLTNGNVLVVWDENRASGDTGIRGRLFQPDGTAIGSELQLNTSGTSFADPKVAALGDGGFLMATNQNNNILLLRYNSSGGLLSSSTVNTSGKPGGDANVAALADGGYVVSYTDVFSSSDLNIRATIFNADGSIRIADFSIDSGSLNQSESSLAALPNGNFAIVYTDSGFTDENGSSAIDLRVVRPNGTIASGYIHVNPTSPYDVESAPDVAILQGGVIAVTYTLASSGLRIKGRMFDQNGDPIEINDSTAPFGYGGPYSASPSQQTNSAISALAGDRFITTWRDSTSDGSGSSIHANVSYFLSKNVNGDASNDVFVGTDADENFTGGNGDNRFILQPGGGADFWSDFHPGASSVDKIVLAAFPDFHTFADVSARFSSNPTGSSLSLGGSDRLGFGVSQSRFDADDFILEFFGTLKVGLAGQFNPSNGWTDQNSFPRQLADVNGDKSADIVAFGNGGVYVARASIYGDGSFDAPDIKLNAFNPANGWTSQEAFPRLFGDVNGDGKADIVAFGNGGVYVALANANGDGGFAAPVIKLNAFNPANGWTSQDQFPRFLADVTGDGRADIVAFGNGGVYVARAHTNGDGGFDAPVITLNAFNPANGWTSQDAFTRLLGDVNGDGRADIVAFGNGGVYVSMATTGGNFTSPVIDVPALNPANGWTSQNQFPRHLADIDNDGMADIVGFGNGGIYVAHAIGAGHFAAPIVDIAAFNPANGWTNDNQFHRAIADVNGDGSADVVGFGYPGVLTALSLVNDHLVI